MRVLLMCSFIYVWFTLAKRLFKYAGARAHYDFVLLTFAAFCLSAAIYVVMLIIALALKWVAVGSL